ncbi:cupin domain-containing protein [Phytoactinopolyspora limicola]|uniref:cupin domain-containing protein n=1 Tax=Phytoactinopolyspora limicola TaxID=2715536 RepID=UPI00140DCCC1|nr:cupin domain-containing protein [Phytoactinopolyspora limicola]
MSAETVTPAVDHYEAVKALGTSPLWQYFGELFAEAPKNQAVPYVWNYQALRPHMLHFAGALSLEEAERRVLMLVNPGMTEPPATVNSLYAGIQIILPGETAQAHRHTANAFRFIIEGEGAYTTVNGERVHMRPGDLLLTPGWHWHDHYHEGDGPMMWLDGLDYPLINALEAGFFQLYGQRSQPAERPDDISHRQFIHGRLNPLWIQPDPVNSPIGNYPWTETERALASIGDDADGSRYDGVLLEYTNPHTGGPVMPTISCRIARLRPGFNGAAHRHTSSTVYHVVSGSGRTEVDGEVLEWGEKDVFAIPGWVGHRHINGSRSDDVLLMSYTNEPVHRALGIYREEHLD